MPHKYTPQSFSNWEQDIYHSITTSSRWVWLSPYYAWTVGKNKNSPTLLAHLHGDHHSAECQFQSLSDLYWTLDIQRGCGSHTPLSHKVYSTRLHMASGSCWYIQFIPKTGVKICKGPPYMQPLLSYYGHYDCVTTCNYCQKQGITWFNCWLIHLGICIQMIPDTVHGIWWSVTTTFLLVSQLRKVNPCKYYWRHCLWQPTYSQSLKKICEMVAEIWPWKCNVCCWPNSPHLI